MQRNKHTRRLAVNQLERRDAPSVSPAGTPNFLVNSVTSGLQIFPAVAMDFRGDFVVAWQSYGQDRSRHRTFAQRFAANGAPQGSELPVNTTVTSFQGFPQIAMDATGDFVIVW